MQSLLSKSINGLLYKEQSNIVGEIYKDGFNAFIVDAQVRFLPKIIEGLNPSPLRFNKCLQSVSWIEIADFEIAKVDFSCTCNKYHSWAIDKSVTGKIPNEFVALQDSTKNEFSLLQVL